MSVSNQKRKQIRKLVTQGENLDPLDLEAFYRWVHTSYKALGFYPDQQRTFDEYCRSSCDTFPMRVYVGLWILRLSLREAPSDNGDRQNHFTPREGASRLPRKNSSRSRGMR